MKVGQIQQEVQEHLRYRQHEERLIQYFAHGFEHYLGSRSQSIQHTPFHLFFETRQFLSRNIWFKSRALARYIQLSDS